VISLSKEGLLSFRREMIEICTIGYRWSEKGTKAGQRKVREIASKRDELVEGDGDRRTTDRIKTTVLNYFLLLYVFSMPSSRFAMYVPSYSLALLTDC
jgi:hypothetical protein